MFRLKPKISKFAILLLVLFLIGVFYGLSVRQSGRLPWHQQVFVSILSPFQKSFTFVGRGIKGIWNHYFYLVGTSKENVRLKKMIDEQRLQMNRLSEVEFENERLRELLNFANRHSLSTIGASVIANDPRSDFRVVTIDKGEADFVKANMPVAASMGLVGKVADVAGGVSRVLLLTDPNSAVDVLIQRSRARAIVVGSMAGTELARSYYIGRLEYLDGRSDIADGDIVVTSGFDGVYPPGIPVGVVRDLENSRHGVFKSANVIPFVDFSNLEEVLVVVK